MRIEFTSVAEIEFEEAVDYYNRAKSGLGFEFAAEVKRTLQRVKNFPEAWHPLSKRTRKCITNRFPYGINQIRKEYILIIAVMHLNRDPQHWKDRE